MVDDERLIYDIRQLLETPGDPPSERVAPLAQAYGKRCDEVNTRLRECGQLLRQGLRGEALQRACHEPSVLDQVTTLDFPERQQFLEICLQCDVEPPARVLNDVAAKLVEAGETERVLSVLMRKHRLLALARVALPKRINTLRQIGQADPDNNIWERDLSKYEQARHQQIQPEAEQAYRAGDLGTLISLEQELVTPDWHQKPPLALIDWVRRATAQLNAVRAMGLLTELAPQLAEAQERDERENALEMKTRWDSCAQALQGKAIPPEIERQASSALAWINEFQSEHRREEEYVAAVAALEEALDGGTGKSRIRNLWSDVQAFNRPVPERLEELFRQNDRVQRRQRARRLAIVSMAALFAVVTISGSIGAGVYFARQSQIAADHLGTLMNLVDQQRLDEARAYLANLSETDANMAGKSEFRSMDVRIGGLIEKERLRRQQVAEVLSSIDRVAELDSPSVKSLASADQQIKAAETLDLKPSDVLQLKFSAERIAAARVELQEKTNTEFASEIATLGAQADSLAQAMGRGEDVRSELQKLLQTMKALRARSGQVSPEKVAALDVMLKQQESLERDLQARGQRQLAVRRVSEAVPNLTVYRDALASYAQQYSGTPRATQFGASGKEAPLWQAVERWARFADRWANIEMAKLSPTEASAFLADATPMLADEITAAFPAAAGVRARLKYAETIAIRDADNRSAIKKLNVLFNEPTLANLKMVQVNQATSGVKRYYVIDPPVATGTGEQVTLKMLTGFDLQRRNTVVQRSQIITSGESLDAPAPQSVVSKHALELLGKDLDRRGWETTFLDLIEVIEKANDLDPLVRLMMLDRVLETATKGSESLAKAAQPMRDAITAADVLLTVNWINPDEEPAKLERQKALSVLGRLSKTSELRTFVDTDLAQFKLPWLQRYQWVGCLLKEDSPAGMWTCSTKAESGLTGDLVVVYREGDKGKIAIEKIGKLKQGSSTLETGNTASLAEGRAVFVAR